MYKVAARSRTCVLRYRIITLYREINCHHAIDRRRRSYISERIRKMKRTPRVCVTRNTPYYTQRIGEQSVRRCSLLFPHEGSKRVRKTALARGYACSSAFIRFAKQQYVSMYAALRRVRNMKSLDIARTRRSKETYAIRVSGSISFFFFFVYRKNFSFLRYYLCKYSVFIFPLIFVFD